MFLKGLYDSFVIWVTLLMSRLHFQSIKKLFLFQNKLNTLAGLMRPPGRVFEVPGLDAR
jgi:hypothetical protein